MPAVKSLLSCCTWLRHHSHPLNLQHSALRKLSSVPPSVIVDGNYDIIHLSEHAGRHLQLGGGTSTLNLLHIVHLELRAALFRAKQIGTQVIVSEVPLEIEGAHRRIDLCVSPGAQDLTPDFLLVFFDAKEEIAKSETFSARSVEPLMQQLESLI